MRLLRLRRSWLYPISFVPAALMFYYGLIPQHYRDNAVFREIVEYDYLMRTHQWQSIAEKSAQAVPQSEHGIRVTNHALAIQGRLLDEMFFYQQTGPKGLLADDQQQEPLTYYALSDIYMHLGFVNESERLAFNAKQSLPDHHKSGRAFFRLAETNIINGNYTIARKYLNYLSSTLYYGSWARNWLEKLGDETYTEQQYGGVRRRRTTQVNHLIAPDKSIMLTELVQRDSTNRLAMDYLLAYDLLTEANSHDAESFHNWSLNSRWIVFTSRRDDGLYTNLYFAHVSADGKVFKAFRLPQRNPKEFDEETVCSFNTPDFASGPVTISRQQLYQKIMSSDRQGHTLTIRK